MIAKMTYDVAAPFIEACLQLLPVLWVVIAVESSWLRRAIQSPSRVSRPILENTAATIFGVGALGIVAGLFCIFQQVQSGAVLTLVTLALFMASAASGILAGLALFLIVKSSDR